MRYAMKEIFIRIYATCTEPEAAQVITTSLFSALQDHGQHPLSVLENDRAVRVKNQASRSVRRSFPSARSPASMQGRGSVHCARGLNPPERGNAITPPPPVAHPSKAAATGLPAAATPQIQTADKTAPPRHPSDA